MTRRPEAYDGPGEPVGADVMDADSLGPALDGTDVAIYLVHSPVPDGAPLVERWPLVRGTIDC